MGIGLEELYGQYFSVVYHYFFYKLLHRESAEDLTAQTFLKVAEHLHEYNPERSNAGTWIRRIAHNTLVDFYRTRKISLSIEDAQDGAAEALSVSFEEQYEQIASPKRRALYAALCQLSERERTLVYYKYFLGESYHEISARFGMNESTLASVLQRAKAKLRGLLEQSGEL